MKNKKFRKILRELCCLMLVFVMLGLMACGKDGEEVESASDTQRSAADGLALVYNGASEYTIVRPKQGTREEANAALKLRSYIQQVYGVTLDVKTDDNTFEKEILVGATTREESKDLVLSMRSGESGYRAYGDKLVFASNADTNVGEAVEAFAKEYLKGNSLIVANDVRFVISPKEYPIATLTLGGEDIYRYQIVYSSDEIGTYDAASKLKSVIQKATGYYLEMVLESASVEQECEILVGNVSRASEALRAVGQGDSVIAASGKKLVLGVNSSVINPVCVVDTFLKDYLKYDSASEAFAADKTLDITVSEAKSLATNNPNMIVADDAYLAELDSLEVQRRNSTLNAPDRYLNTGKTTYYVSNDGNDSNDGTSPEKAWATIGKVNSSAGANSVILFNRGDTWRGNLVAKNGMTYAAYGTGAQPVILGSTRNYANASLWEQTSTNGIWKYKGTLDNVGLIVANSTCEIGKMDEKVFYLASSKELPDSEERDFFYSDLANGELYIRCNAGNPGSVYSSIEIAERRHIITVGSATNVTVDNLTLMFTGSHAISGSTGCNGLKVEGCVIAYIGGSVHTGISESTGNTVRYGNGIEIYGGFDGFYVRNNYCYQIFDTAMTFQFSTGEVATTMKNVEFKDNFISHTHMSIEWYNNPTDSTQPRVVENVLISGNFVRYNGYGFGSYGRSSYQSALLSSILPEATTNYVMENNIIDRAANRIFQIYEGGDEKIVFRNNTYIQKTGAVLGQFFDGVDVIFDSYSYDVLTKYNNTGHKLVYVK